MNASTPARGRWIAAVALGLLAGCGPPVATITGTVTYDGQPVKEGYVTFSPADGKGQPAGAPIVDGRYTAEKVAPGPKVVLVTGSEKPLPAIESSADGERLAKEMKAKGGAFKVEMIPPAADGNNRKVDVAPGAQTIDLALKKPPPAPPTPAKK